MRCFIIAEAGVNHNGSEELALRLVEAAADAGADAVKFQTFRAELLAKPGSEKAVYQKSQTGAGDQLSMLRELELSESQHRLLQPRCEQLGIEFMSTPFDQPSVDFLLDLGVRRLKIPSGELTNHPFLKYISTKGVPLILSTGMASLEEVQDAVQVVRSVREQHAFTEPLAEVLTLLHCTSNYPAAHENVNLRAMQTLHQATGLPVGYSDHTEGILVAPVAAALGAIVIEKHFTLDHSLPGPDHAASLEPDELSEMIRNIRNVETLLGSPEKTPTQSELPVRDVVRRSVTLTRQVSRGHTLTQEDLVLLRPGTGIPPKALEQLIGRTVKTDLPPWHTLCWSDLEP